MTMDDQDRGRATDQGDRRIRRSRRDRVAGGVCAGIAHHLDVDPAVVRLVALLLALVSGGGAVLVYVAAWVLLPQDVAEHPAPARVEQVPPAAPEAGGPQALGARQAWSTAGAELRALAGQLRPALADRPRDPVSRAPSPIERVDIAFTSLGDRLRDPRVQADARRAAASVSTALGSTADEVGRRTRRTDPPGGTPG